MPHFFIYHYITFPDYFNRNLFIESHYLFIKIAKKLFTFLTSWSIMYS